MSIYSVLPIEYILGWSEFAANHNRLRIDIGARGNILERQRKEGASTLFSPPPDSCYTSVVVHVEHGVNDGDALALGDVAAGQTRGPNFPTREIE